MSWNIIDDYGSIAYCSQEQKTETKREIPLWEKYVLTIEEASRLFGIGENKIRTLISSDPYKDFILHNGNRALIKRNLFARWIDNTNTI